MAAWYYNRYRNQGETWDSCLPEKTKNKTYSLSIYTLTFVDSKLMSGLFTSWSVSECVSYIWMLLFDAM